MATEKETCSLSRQQKMWLGVTLLLSAAVAQAEGNLIPHALAHYEQDSDLLLVPENPLPVDASGEPRLADSYQNYSGGIDGEYRWRDNRLYLTTNYSRFVYQHFTQLNHNELAGTVGLDWTATHKIKGNIGTQYSRHLISFTEINVADPNLSYIETTQETDASAIYDMNSHWQANAGTSYSTARLPNAGIQSFDLNQTEGKVGLKFLGSSKLTTGISIDRMTGHYKNSVQPGYTQTVYAYDINYKLGARTSIDGTIGYDKRAQTGFDASVTTGSFSFNQQLTVKTSYFLQFRRVLDTYNSTFGSQLNTEWIAGIGWQMTQKILLSANYSYDNARITGYVDINSTSITQRDDKIKAANVNLKYTALRWLTITPFYRYQNRDSQLSPFNFNNNAYGIDFEARFQP